MNKKMDYFWPPEWYEQKAVWLSWPNRNDLWQGHLLRVQSEIINFILRLSRTVKVNCLVNNRDTHAELWQQLKKSSSYCVNCRLEKIHLPVIETNDIWIRDYGPLWLYNKQEFLSSKDVLKHNPVGLLDFRFNAWGEKFSPFDLDDLVSEKISELNQVKLIKKNYVLEGGAIEFNGETLLAARDCIMHTNRRMQYNQNELVQELCDVTGAKTVIWLEGEMPGDDTGGHIDMYARFADSNTLLYNACHKNQPAFKMLEHNRKILQSKWLSTCDKHQIVDLPMPPDKYLKAELLPRTYANLLISNKAVFVPIYNEATDREALDIIASVFPSYKIEPVFADDLILEGGAIHCMTMPEF